MKRYQNKPHLRHVAEQGCMKCGGPAVAHHLLRPWTGTRGTGRRAGDQNAVALCDGHHRALHARGDENAWFFEQFGNESSGRAAAERLWLESPAYEAAEFIG